MATPETKPDAPKEGNPIGEADKANYSGALAPDTDNTVTVKVVAGAPFWDHCVKYQVGDTLTTTAARAAELGERVQPV